MRFGERGFQEREVIGAGLLTADAEPEEAEVWMGFFYRFRNPTKVHARSLSSRTKAGRPQPPQAGSRTYMNEHGLVFESSLPPGVSLAAAFGRDVLEYPQRIARRRQLLSRGRARGRTRDGGGFPSETGWRVRDRRRGKEGEVGVRGVLVIVSI
jgi:hypothetical protein